MRWYSGESSVCDVSLPKIRGEENDTEHASPTARKHRIPRKYSSKDDKIEGNPTYGFFHCPRILARLSWNGHVFLRFLYPQVETKKQTIAGYVM